MKRTLLLALLMGSATATFAQRATKASPAKPATAQPADAPAVDPKLMFSSKINELDASLSRNRAEAAKTVYNELQTMMETDLRASKQKPYLNNRTQLYNEVRIMATQDLAANREKVVAKLREYLGYL